MRSTSSYLITFLLIASAPKLAHGVRPQAEQPSAAFSPDGKSLAILTPDRTLRVLDVSTGKELTKTILKFGPDEVPEQVRYAADGQLFVMLCRHKGFTFGSGQTRHGTISACMHSISSGKRSPFIEVGFGGLAVCPKGEVLAYGNRLWDVATGRMLREIGLPNGLVYDIEFSPDGRKVLYRICESLAQDAALLFVADVAKGTKILQVGDFDWENYRFGGYLFAVKFSPDSTRITFEERDRPALHVRDLTIAKAARRIPLKECEVLVGFSADGKGLITWRQFPADGTIRLWEVSTGEQRKLGTVGGGRVDAVILSPDGQMLAAIRKGTVTFHQLRN